MFILFHSNEFLVRDANLRPSPGLVPAEGVGEFACRAILRYGNGGRPYRGAVVLRDDYCYGQQIIRFDPLGFDLMVEESISIVKFTTMCGETPDEVLLIVQSFPSAVSCRTFALDEDIRKLHL